MVDGDRKQLYAFGYGLALLIPFLVLLHSVKSGLSFGVFMLYFLGGFLGLMVIINRIAGWMPRKNSWIFLFQLAVILHVMQKKTVFVPMVLLGLSVACLIVALCDVSRLKKIYSRWMWLARRIGLVVSGLILAILFYGVFAPVGLFLRLTRRDLLDRPIDPRRTSYWCKREYVFDKENYKRQF